MAAQRNAGHRAEHAGRLAAAAGEMERLAAACDWFRAPTRCSPGRPPRGIPDGTPLSRPGSSATRPRT
jgi:hypothetical protein